MQGLAHYADTSPTPSPPRAGPSRLRDDVETPSVVGKRDALEIHSVKVQVKAKRPRKSSPIVQASSTTSARDEMPREVDPVDSSITAPLPSSSETVNPEQAEPELDEDEIFRRVTRPPDIPGLKDWGIPDEVDPDLCSSTLKSKVEQYLRLKYEKDQHINTSLLSSTSFANPHIYAKLVEYTSLNETSSHIPTLTRQNLELQIPKYGPSSLSASQKAQQEASAREKEAGKRGKIDFTSGKYDDKSTRGGKREREGEGGEGELWIKRTDRDHGRRREEGGVKRSGSTATGNKERARERERHRDKERERDGRDGGRWSGRDSQR